MRVSTYEFHRMKDKTARDKAWQERLDRDPRSDAYRYNVRMADLENQRKIALQEAKNKGLLDVENRRQTGMTGRTGLEQAGATKRIGMEQSGWMDRTKLTERGKTDRDTRRYAQELYASLVTDQINPETGTIDKKGVAPDLARKIVAGSLMDLEDMSGDGRRYSGAPDWISKYTGGQPAEKPATTLADIPVKSPRTGLLQKGTPLIKDQSDLILDEERESDEIKDLGLPINLPQSRMRYENYRPRTLSPRRRDVLREQYRYGMSPQVTGRQATIYDIGLQNY